jgi:PIN domain nuclease of toxin-antitoxin system
MSLLLDTHALLWFLIVPDRLDRATRRKIESPRELVFVSSVSAWEIEIKREVGKLKAPGDLETQLRQNRFTELPLHLRHVQTLRALPTLHRDPFDRMLVAQAIADNLTLVTSDDQVRSYPVKTLPA